jgi:nucleoid-associated protein YgaU
LSLKRRAVYRFRGLFASAIAVCVIGFGFAGCSSDEEGADEPTPELVSGEGASDEQLLNGDEGLANNSENALGEGEVPPLEGNNAFLENTSDNVLAGDENLENLNNEALTAEDSEGSLLSEGTDNNAVGAELEGLVNESSSEMAGAQPEGDSAFADASTAEDPFAQPADGAYAESTGSEGSDAGAGFASTPAEGSVVPEEGTLMPYFVRSGDTLSVIASRVYGNPGKWRDLASVNNLADPNRIYVGDVIYYRLDGGSKQFAQQYEGAARASVQVGQGDTLYSISSRVYGSGINWKVLWRDNPQINNPDQLRVGMTIIYRNMSGVAASSDSTDPMVGQVEAPETAPTAVTPTLVEDLPQVDRHGAGEMVSLGGGLADWV